MPWKRHQRIREAIIRYEIGDSCPVARKTKGTLGGWRPGAGRKPVLKDRTRLTVHLEKADLETLQDKAQEKGISVGALIRQVVGSYLKRGRR